MTEKELRAALGMVDNITSNTLSNTEFVKAFVKLMENLNTNDDKCDDEICDGKCDQCNTKAEAKPTTSTEKKDVNTNSNETYKYVPKFDVYENYKVYRIDVSLPGVSNLMKDAFTIKIDNNHLIITNKTKFDRYSEKSTNIYSNIDIVKPFELKIKLKEVIDLDNMLAELYSGILSILVYKQIKSSKSPISIKIK